MLLLLNCTTFFKMKSCWLLCTFMNDLNMELCSDLKWRKFMSFTNKVCIHPGWFCTDRPPTTSNGLLWSLHTPFSLG